MIVGTAIIGLLISLTAAAPSLDGYKIIFADDFNDVSGGPPSASRWNQITEPYDNGNHEVQDYTDRTSNTRVENGELLIIPVKRSSWTSGRMESKGAWGCPDGRAMIFQAEIKIPDFTGSPSKYHGLWPAFWAKGNAFRGNPGVGWPKCGEWDIFEVHGKMSNRQQATIHWEGPAPQKEHRSLANSTTYPGNQYNVWAIKVDRRPADWKQQSLTFWNNGQQYAKFTGADFTGQTQWSELAYKSFYMILNIAVGGPGSYPGETSAETVSGIDAAMRVKYVAVYQST